MIKADFIDDKDLTRIIALKKFMSKNGMHFCGESFHVSFNRGPRRWFDVRMGYPGNKWTINRTMSVTI